MDDFYHLFIDGETFKSGKNVKLPEISIDNNLSFEDHTSTSCKKESYQLNMTGRMQRYLGFKTKETKETLASIIVPLYGISVHPSQ